MSSRGESAPKQDHCRNAEPDWAAIYRELKRKHVTLAMLWDEHIERHPEGYSYSRFCELYRGWVSRLSVHDAASPFSAATSCLSITPASTVPMIVDRLPGQARDAAVQARKLTERPCSSWRRRGLRQSAPPPGGINSRLARVPPLSRSLLTDGARYRDAGRALRDQTLD